VGRIVEIEANLHNPDNPVIEVKWLEWCDYHDLGTKSPLRFLLDELWEIGQI